VGGRRRSAHQCVGGGSGRRGCPGTQQPRPFSSPSEPEELGAWTKPQRWHHDAREFRAGSHSRGAPRSGQRRSGPHLSTSSPPPPPPPLVPLECSVPLFPSHPAAATEDASAASAPASPAGDPCAPGWSHSPAAPRRLPPRRPVCQRDRLWRPVSALGRGATLPAALTPGQLGSAARAAPQLLQAPRRRGQTLVLLCKCPRQGGLGLLRLHTRCAVIGAVSE
jgi:hypothetical protein